MHNCCIVRKRENIPELSIQTMGSVRNLGIYFDGDVNVFSPGDFIRGEVELLVNADGGGHGLKLVKGLSVRFRGKAKNQFAAVDADGEYRTRKEKEHYFDTSVVVFGTGGQQGDIPDLSIPPGRSIFRFEFRLPREILPSSFEGSCGYVRYKAKATLSLLRMVINKTYSVQRLFAVTGPRVDLNRMQRITVSVRTNVELNSCCGCGSVLETIVSFGLPKQGYVPGESIYVTGHVDNRDGQEIRNLDAQFLQVITHRIGCRLTKTVDHIVSRASATVACPRGQVTEFTVGPLQIPAVPSSGLPGCNITDMEYCVQCAVSGHEKRFSVTIGTVPLPIPALMRHGDVASSSSSLPSAHTPQESTRLLEAFASESSAHDYGSSPPPSYDEVARGSHQGKSYERF